MAPKSKAPVIIIRRTEEDGHGGHHGGGWKVAYADFMTAMMAFFLLMWILGASDEDQRRGLADYFAPTLFALEGGFGLADGSLAEVNGSQNFQAGPVIAIVTPEFGKNGFSIVEVDSRNSLAKAVGPGIADGVAPAHQEQIKTTDTSDETVEAAEKAQAGQEEAFAEAHKFDQDRQFENLEAEILQAMEKIPDLAPLEANLIFDKSEDGLRIQIIDQQSHSMYAVGSARADGAALKLMSLVGETIAGLPNKILISGHTDARPYANNYSYSNWELSADRANATRRIFQNSGVDADRIIRISGLADTELLNPADPRHPSNRRISVVLEYLPDETYLGTTNQVTGANGAHIGTTNDLAVTGTLSLSAGAKH